MPCKAGRSTPAPARWVSPADRPVATSSRSSVVPRTSSDPYPSVAPVSVATSLSWARPAGAPKNGFVATYAGAAAAASVSCPWTRTSTSGSIGPLPGDSPLTPAEGHHRPVRRERRLRNVAVGELAERLKVGAQEIHRPLAAFVVISQKGRARCPLTQRSAATSHRHRRRRRSTNRSVRPAASFQDSQHAALRLEKLTQRRMADSGAPPAPEHAADTSRLDSRAFVLRRVEPLLEPGYPPV